MANGQGSGDRAGGWPGHPPAAPYRRPRQAGGAVRWHLPAHRLRAVEPGQRRLPEDRGAHAVQEPQPRPAHHHDLANVDAARQLRDSGAGPTAGRAALVLGVGRRDLPEPEPRLRRAARLHHGVRRRPHLPHGPAPDARPAHRFGRRRNGRRDPGPAQGGVGVRRDPDGADRRRCRPPDRGVP